ncbi:hypothetical protein OROHE_022838 [Orobanche hederae]
MVSFSARSFISPFFFSNPENPNIKSNPSYIQINPKKPISKNPPKTLICTLNAASEHQNHPLSCTTITNQPLATIQTSTVSRKVRSLDFEFRSLPDPIDRVKRLLHYATVLPPFDESLRNQENRVMGCAARVWLVVKMDRDGIMSFRADSDSEITKGFCSCLIWVLDGAEADEVLSVRSEDLLEMNVGLASRVSSRFNAWHSVLVSMQRRTKALVE